MSHADAHRYDGRHAVVVGGATGMGAAVADVLADLGATLTVLDRAEVTRSDATTGVVDLANRDSIDAATAALDRPIDALLCCAGVADGTPGIERINFIGHRRFIDTVIDRGLLGQGSSIGFISSAAGLGWQHNLDALTPLLELTDFDDAAAYARDHGLADYFHTKQTINAYVAREAFALLKRGIRINAISPGPTDTPLARANAELWLGFGADYRAEVALDAATPIEQAHVLAFLCSAAAAGITGVTIVTDAGYVAAGITGSFPAATPMVKMLLGE